MLVEEYPLKETYQVHYQTHYQETPKAQKIVIYQTQFKLKFPFHFQAARQYQVQRPVQPAIQPRQYSSSENQASFLIKQQLKCTNKCSDRETGFMQIIHNLACKTDKTEL